MSQKKVKIDMWCVGYCRPMTGSGHAVLSYLVEMITLDGKPNMHENAIYVGDNYTKKQADILSVIAVLKIVDEQYFTSDVVLHVPSSYVRKATIRKPNGEWVAKIADYPSLIEKMRVALAMYSSIEVVQSAPGERHLKDCIRQAKRIMNERN